MRRAGAAAAEVLAAVGAAVAPGITTDELDAIGHEECIAARRLPEPAQLPRLPQVAVHLGQRGHLPRHPRRPRRCVDGDIVNLDVTVFLDGVHGDTNATFLVGEVDDDVAGWCRSPASASSSASPPYGPGRPISDIGPPSSPTPRPRGFGVVRAFVGHGIGEAVPRRPHVPHYYDPAATTVMVPGMTFTIEPMISVGDVAPPDVGRRLDRGHRRPPPHRAVRAHAAGHRRRRRGPHPASHPRRAPSFRR